jgi:hypothetical protein
MDVYLFRYGLERWLKQQGSDRNQYKRWAIQLIKKKFLQKEKENLMIEKYDRMHRTKIEKMYIFGFV